MIDAADPITIRSEEDAWSVLEVLSNPNVNDRFAAGGLRLIGWPEEIVYLPNEVHSGISVPMMEAFVEMQGCIYRSYLAASGRPLKLNFLTTSEKSSLSVKVIVTGGSASYNIDPNDIVKTLVRELVGKMPIKAIVSLATLIILLFFGIDAYKAWLSHDKEIEQSKITSDKDIRLLEIASEERKNLSSKETERQRLLFEYINKFEAHRVIKEQSEASYEAMLKGVAKSGGGRYLGVYVTPERVDEILEKPKTDGAPFKLQTRYKVEKIEDGGNGLFKAWLSDRDSGVELSADFSAMTLSADQRNLLFKSLDSGPTVSVVINGWQRGGKIVRAEILRVEECN